MPVVIYTAKEYQSIWLHQRLDYRRLWFAFEIDFFFKWLLSIVIYLQVTFRTTPRSLKDEDEELTWDINIWNKKNTADHLRWVKKETFDLSIQFTYFISIIVIGFFKSEHMDLYGPREFMPAGIILLVLLIQHGIHILWYIKIMRQEKKE